jgi:hypothetical protein
MPAEMLLSGWMAPVGHLLEMGPGGREAKEWLALDELSLSAPTDSIGVLPNHNEPELPELS